MFDILYLDYRNKLEREAINALSFNYQVVLAFCLYLCKQEESVQASGIKFVFVNFDFRIRSFT